MNRHNLFWGGVLILAGVLFLGNNLNWFSLRVEALWPILLIVLGAYILLSRYWPAPPESEPTSVIPLEGATRADLRLSYGIDKLRLVGGGTGSNFLSASGNFQERVQRDGDTLRVRLETGLRGVLPWNWGQGNQSQIQLHAQTPTNLKVECGAAATTLDLRETQVQQLEIETGVSSTTLTTPQNAGHTRAKISGGAASFAITIPEGVAARIEIESGLGSIAIDQNRFPRNHGVYQSVDYDKAANKLDLSIEIGVSALSIE